MTPLNLSPTSLATKLYFFLLRKHPGARDHRVRDGAPRRQGRVGSAPAPAPQHAAGREPSSQVGDFIPAPAKCLYQIQLKLFNC